MPGSLHAPRLSLAVLVAASVALPSDGPRPASPAAPSARSACALVGSRCKPTAALDVGFEVIETRGEFVDVGFTVQPRASLRDVRWELVPTGSASLVEGTAEGLVDDPAAVVRATLHVPSDGTYKTAELVVRGTMRGSRPGGETFDEPVTATRMLEWERPESFLPLVPGRDPTSGDVVMHPRVPSRWTPAPAQSVVGAAPSTADDDGTFLVTGVFLYEDKEWGWSGWQDSDPLLPIRRADVTVVDALTGDVLGQGSTAQDGSFAVSCDAGTPRDLFVRCESDTGLDTGFQRLRVTPHNAIDYVADGPVFGHDGLADLDAGTVTALKTTIGIKEGNPFNIFDMSVCAWEWLMGPAVGEGVTPPAIGIEPVRTIWPNGAYTFAQDWGPWIGDDDGYDDPVILHELGHVVHAQYSNNDTVGGAHNFGDSDQDPRVSIGEGFATCFNGLVLASIGRKPLYVDSKGWFQLKGWSLRLNVETVEPYVNDAAGSADEVAVCCALYDLLDDAGAPDATPDQDDDAFDGSLLVRGVGPTKAFWQVFTGPMAEAFVLTHNDTWDGWIAVHGDDPSVLTLRELFADHGQFFFADDYEPVGGTQRATRLPLSVDGGWIAPLTFFRAPDWTLAPGAYDDDWFAHELVEGSVVTFETRYPGGAGDADTQADPQMELFAPDGSLVAFDQDSGPGRNARVASFLVTETGTWRVRLSVQDYEWPFSMEWYLRRYGTYEYRASAVFENHLPVITEGPHASSASVSPGQRVLLEAVATDPDEGQALEFEWRPVDGGTIHGSGPSVFFAPPVVPAGTRVRIELVVRDELGAVSAPGLVEVVVGAP